MINRLKYSKSRIYFILGFILLFSFTPVIEGKEPISSPDGTWIVEQYRNGNGELISPLPDAPISAMFLQENLTGKMGCNEYATQYTAAGGAILIPSSTVTQNVCSPSVKAQEDEYLQDLKHVALYQVNESRLSLFDDDEELLVSYIAQV
ncbi:MAG TPA: META domain-containing protein [Methanospirillum sp.]|uniref:META domain-containing protein n=1 Tax=Methanospirillum sp. TaxID=45200 RepID=UPI002B793A31|nr:META domain-containing protein [Methanospirillum sp.]HWQ63984.1 META domain-containing protein [Methanospirillum sp.]